MGPTLEINQENKKKCKTIYKEFVNAQDIADYYNANNIIQIVKLENGFGVFSKEPNFIELDERFGGLLPSTAYYGRLPKMFENGFDVDLTKWFGKDEWDAVYEASKILVPARFYGFEVELIDGKIVCTKLNDFEDSQ